MPLPLHKDMIPPSCTIRCSPYHRLTPADPWTCSNKQTWLTEHYIKHKLKVLKGISQNNLCLKESSSSSLSDQLLWMTKLSKPKGMNIISNKIRDCIVGQYVFIPLSYCTIGKLANEAIERKKELTKLSVFTCKKTLSLSSGAVPVLDTAPAIAPATSCLQTNPAFRSRSEKSSGTVRCSPISSIYSNKGFVLGFFHQKG